MPISTITKTKRDGTLTILDNAGANVFIVQFEEGDYNLAIPGPQEQVFLDRGQFTPTPQIRYGDDAAMSGTFTARLRDVSDAAFATLGGILAESGFVNSTWVSTLGANAEVRLYTMRVDIEGTDHGDATDHRIECNFCKFSGSIAEGVPDTISMSFTSYDVYPTVT